MAMKRMSSEEKAFKTARAVQKLYGNSMQVSDNRLTVKSSKHRGTSDADLLAQYKEIVYGCCKTNAENVAGATLRVYVRGGTKRFQTRILNNAEKKHLKTEYKIVDSEDVEEVVDHPLNVLLHTFNDLYPAMTGFELTQLYLDLIGKNYWYTPRNSIGIPQEIVPLQAQFSKPLYSPKQKKIVAYELKNGSITIHYKPEEIVYFRYPNPSNPIDGLSPLQAAIGEVFLTNSEREYEQALYDNGARPDLLINPKAGTTKNQEERFMSKWTSRHQGSTNAGKPAFLSGDIALHQIGFTPREANALVRIKFSREEICNIFDNPVSRFQNANSRAQVEAYDLRYQKEGIMPRLKLIASTINKYLVPMYGNAPGQLFVAYDSTIPEDREYKLKERESNLRTGYSSINMERAKEGKEDVDWGYEPWLAMNLIQTGSEPPQQTAPMKTKELQKPLDPPQKRLSRTLNKTLDKYTRIALGRLGSGKTVNKTTSGELLNKKAMQSEIYKESIIEIGEFVEKGGIMGIEHLRSQGLDVEDFLVSNPNVEKFTKEYTVKFSKSVPDTFDNDLKKYIIDAKNAGEGNAYIVKKIKENHGVAINKRRAEMISRTESKRALEQGQLQSWIESDVVSGKEWLAFGDACPFCQAMNGKTVALEKPYFEQGGDPYTVPNVDKDGKPIMNADGKPGKVSMSFGYSDVDAPPLHPSCRCSTIAIVK